MNNPVSPWGMMRQLFAESRPFMQLILIVILMGSSAIFFSFIAMIIAVPLFSMPFSELQSALESGFTNSDVSLLRYFQAVQTIGLFLVPALITRNLVLREEVNWFRVKSTVNYRSVGFLLLLTLMAALPLIHFLAYLNEAVSFPEAFSALEEKLMEMETERMELGRRLIASEHIGTLLVNLLIIAILPALAEEFMFRGIMQPIFGKWTGNHHWGIFIAAIIFSLFHLQFYGFLPRLALGVYFGYLLLWTGNIWIPVLAHFLNNALAVGFTFAIDSTDKNVSGWFGADTVQIIYPVVLSTLFTTLLIILTRKASVSK